MHDLPDAGVHLPARLDGVELEGVLGLLDKDRELQELLCDAQVGEGLHEILKTTKMEENISKTEF